MPLKRLGADVNLTWLNVPPIESLRPLVPPETKARVAPAERVRPALVSTDAAPSPAPLVAPIVALPLASVICPTVSVDRAPEVLLPRWLEVPPVRVLATAS